MSTMVLKSNSEPIQRQLMSFYSYTEDTVPSSQMCCTMTSKAPSRTFTLALDYSKPTNWSIDKLCLKDVDIKSLWESGRFYVESASLYDGELDIIDLVTAKVTMSKQRGKKKVGVRSMREHGEEEIGDDEDSRDHVDEGEVIDNDDDRDQMEVDDGNQVVPPVACSIIDYVEEPSSRNSSDPQIEVNGNWHYKASIIRQNIRREFCHQ